MSLLALAVTLVGCSFWPGLIHWDSAQVIHDARSGVAVDWWTGLGTLGLRFWFSLGMGLPAVWMAMVLANVLGLYGCLRLTFRRVTAALVTLGIVVFPVVYGELAALSRDNAWRGFSLLAFAFLGRALRGRPSTCRGPLALSFVFAVLATISRQNGLSEVFAVVMFAMLFRRPRTWRRVLVALLIAMVAGVSVFVGLHAIGAALGVRSVDPERMTYVYDLAALSVATRHDAFPQRSLRSLAPGGAAPHDMSEAGLRRNFRIWDALTISGVRQMSVDNAGLAAHETAILRSAWTHAVEHHPLAYLDERLSLYISSLGLGGRPPEVAPYLNLFAFTPLESVSNYGHPLALPGNYQRAAEILGFFLGDHATLRLDQEWLYALLTVGSLVWLFRRGSSTFPLAATMGSAVLVNQIVLFFTEMAASARYVLTPQVALVCFAFALCECLRRVDHQVLTAMSGRIPWGWGAWIGSSAASRVNDSGRQRLPADSALDGQAEGHETLSPAARPMQKS